MIRALMWLIALMALPVSAQEFVESEGQLSDRDFYRLVSCAADPGGTCRKDVVRWPARKAKRLRIKITRIDPSFPAQNARRAKAALTKAAAEITNLNAGVRINRTTGRPDISVLLLDLPEGSVLHGTGIDGLDGNRIGVAYVHVWWDWSRRITKSVIIMTPSLAPSDTDSVMLEELVQSLGLLTDINNPHYRGKSIFDEDSNDVTQLIGQDETAIRMHYTR